jgi:hypothetical protein
MGKKDAHIFVLLHNDVFIWRLHTSRPDGNVTSVAPKLFSVFSNFLEKKSTMRMKGVVLTIKIRHPIVHVLLCVCFLSGLFEGYFFLFQKKENKKQKAIVRHMVGWEKMYR